MATSHSISNPVRYFVQQKLQELNMARYEGILLCEGDVNSIDQALYSAFYPHLYVIPVGSCASVMVLQYDPYPVFGMIDRDDVPKADLRARRKKGIYSTKLPFIENLISCPEIIDILLEERGEEIYQEKSAQKEKKSVDLSRKLLKVLCRKLIMSVPVNLGFRESENISCVIVRIEKADGTAIEKRVSETDVMYAYHDKVVANEAALFLGINGKKEYYKYFKRCLKNPKVRDKILNRLARYLPEITVEKK